MSGLKRTTPLRQTPFKPKKGKVWKRLKPISDRRRKDWQKYDPKKKKYLSEHPICERCGKGRSCHIHHKRGRWKDRLHDETQFCAVCFECHNWIELNREQARNEGWLVDRIGTPQPPTNTKETETHENHDRSRSGKDGGDSNVHTDQGLDTDTNAEERL